MAKNEIKTKKERVTTDPEVMELKRKVQAIESYLRSLSSNVRVTITPYYGYKKKSKKDKDDLEVKK